MKLKGLFDEFTKLSSEMDKGGTDHRADVARRLKVIQNLIMKVRYPEQKDQDLYISYY